MKLDLASGSTLTNPPVLPSPAASEPAGVPTGTAAAQTAAHHLGCSGMRETECQALLQRLRERALLRNRTGLSPAEQYVKRALDLCLGGLLLPLAAVLVGVAMLLIRLESPGAPWFCQWRTGRHGHRFRLWKLRTMVQNAEQLKPQLQALNELAWPDFKISQDPRVTAVGRWLRRCSLDELPQLWNVLRGDMSLVGPRPTSFSSDTYQPWHTERLEVLPGMTGLWQVLARGESEFDERLRLDVAYVRGYSLGLDLWLLWATVRVVVTGKGGK